VIQEHFAVRLSANQLLAGREALPLPFNDQEDSIAADRPRRQRYATDGEP